ncbi:MAG: hypothetical protein IJ065_07940 [Eubacterium sp.]|nr:hypothetical protein [Eubacterium sp.]
MKKLGYALYMLVGAGLVLSGFATTEKGFKENNRTEMDRVASDYEELGDMGFKGFCPLDYKVAFSNGEKDVVVDYNGGDYKVAERNAVYEGLVGSIYQNGEEFEVVVPEYDTWITLQAGSGEQLSAVIWHESFHAYQNSYCRLGDKVDQEMMSETELAEQVDNDSEKKRLYTKELEILSRLTDEENTCDASEIALEYISMADERNQLLTDEENASEAFYEMMEGSAYYVEAHAVRYENGEAVYKENYLDNDSEYVNGNSKYYHHGMLECMLLDELDPEWKDSYTFDRSLDEVIAEYVTNN